MQKFGKGQLIRHSISLFPSFGENQQCHSTDDHHDARELQGRAMFVKDEQADDDGGQRFQTAHHGGGRRANTANGLDEREVGNQRRQ